MNKIYRIKRNDQGELVVVSELTTVAGKTAHTSQNLLLQDSTLASTDYSLIKLLQNEQGFGVSTTRPTKLIRKFANVGNSVFFALAIVGSIGMSANPSYAASNPQVVIGQAAIDIANNVTNIRSFTDRTVINWKEFNIGKNEIYNFIQNNTNSAVLNRVLGGSVSQILGTLKSNGQVFVVNPAGIVFGKNAVVDVNTFVASTLDISNEDFLKGKLHFSQKEQLSAAIVNQGLLTVGKNGKLALIGGQVTNAGTLSAKDGNVYLLAGKSITIADLNNPSISYTITAENQAVNLGEIFTGKGVHILANKVFNQGNIDASAAVLTNGTVQINGVDTGTGTLTGTTLSINQSGATLASTPKTTTSKAANTASQTGYVVNNGKIKAHQIHVNASTVVALNNSSMEAVAAQDAAGKIHLGGMDKVLSGAELKASGKHAARLITTDGASFTAQSTATNKAEILSYATDAAFAGKWQITEGAGIIETSGNAVKFSDKLELNANNGSWYLDPTDIHVISGNVNSVTYKIELLEDKSGTSTATSLYNLNVDTATNFGSYTADEGKLTSLRSSYENSGTSEQTYAVTLTDTFITNQLKNSNISIYTPDGNITFTNTNLTDDKHERTLSVIAPQGNITVNNATFNIRREVGNNQAVYGKVEFFAGKDINVTGSSFINLTSKFYSNQNIKITDSRFFGPVVINATTNALSAVGDLSKTPILATERYFAKQTSTVEQPFVTMDESTSMSSNQNSYEGLVTILNPDVITTARKQDNLQSLVTSSKGIILDNTSITFGSNYVNIDSDKGIKLKDVQFTSLACYSQAVATDSAYGYVSNLSTTGTTTNGGVASINASAGSIVQEGYVAANGAMLFINTTSSNDNTSAYIFTAGSQLSTGVGRNNNVGVIRLDANATGKATAITYVGIDTYIPTHTHSLEYNTTTKQYENKLIALEETLKNEITLSGSVNIRAKSSSETPYIGDFTGSKLNVEDGVSNIFVASTDNKAAKGGNFYFANVSLHNSTLRVMDLNQDYSRVEASEDANVTATNLTFTGVRSENKGMFRAESRGTVSFLGDNSTFNQRNSIYVDSDSRFLVAAPKVEVNNMSMVVATNPSNNGKQVNVPAIFAPYYANQGLELNFTNSDAVFTSSNLFANSAKDLTINSVNSIFDGIKNANETNSACYTGTTQFNFIDTTFNNSQLVFNGNTTTSDASSAATAGTASVTLANTTFNNTTLNLTASNINLQQATTDQVKTARENALLDTTDTTVDYALKLNASNLILATGNHTADGFRDQGTLTVNNFNLVLDESPLLEGTRSDSEVTLAAQTVNFATDATSNWRVNRFNTTADTINLNGKLHFDTTNSVTTNTVTTQAGTKEGEQTTVGTYLTAYQINQAQGSNFNLVNGTGDFHATQGINLQGAIKATNSTLYFGDYRSQLVLTGSVNEITDPSVATDTTGTVTTTSKQGLANYSQYLIELTNGSLNSDTNVVFRNNLELENTTINLAVDTAKNQLPTLKVTGTLDLNEDAKISAASVEVAKALSITDGTISATNDLTVGGIAGLNRAKVEGNQLTFKGSLESTSSTLNANDVTVARNAKLSNTTANVVNNFTATSTFTANQGSNLQLGGKLESTTISLQDDNTKADVNKVNATNLYLTKANLSARAVALTDKLEASAAKISVTGDLVADKLVNLTNNSNLEVQNLLKTTTLNLTDSTAKTKDLTVTDINAVNSSLIVTNNVVAANLYVSKQATLDVSNKLQADAATIDNATLKSKHITVEKLAAENQAQVTVTNLQTASLNSNANAAVVVSNNLTAEQVTADNATIVASNLSSQELTLSNDASVTAQRSLTADTVTLDSAALGVKGNANISQNFTAHNSSVVAIANLSANTTKVSDSDIKFNQLTSNTTNLSNSTFTITQNASLGDTTLNSTSVLANNKGISITTNNATLINSTAAIAELQVNGNLTASNNSRLVVDNLSVTGSNTSLTDTSVLVNNNATFALSDNLDLSNSEITVKNILNSTAKQTSLTSSILTSNQLEINGSSLAYDNDSKLTANNFALNTTSVSGSTQGVTAATLAVNCEVTSTGNCEDFQGITIKDEANNAVEEKIEQATRDTAQISSIAEQASSSVIIVIGGGDSSSTGDSSADQGSSDSDSNSDSDSDSDGEKKDSDKKDKGKKENNKETNKGQHKPTHPHTNLNPRNLPSSDEFGGQRRADLAHKFQVSSTKLNADGSQVVNGVKVNVADNGDMTLFDPTPYEPSVSAINNVKASGIADLAIPYGKSDANFERVSKTAINDVFTLAKTQEDTIRELQIHTTNINTKSQLTEYDRNQSYEQGIGGSPVRPYGVSVNEYKATKAQERISNFTDKSSVQLLLNISKHQGINSQDRKFKSSAIATAANNGMVCIPAMNTNAIAQCYAPGSIIPNPQTINISNQESSGSKTPTSPTNSNPQDNPQGNSSQGTNQASTPSSNGQSAPASQPTSQPPK